MIKEAAILQEGKVYTGRRHNEIIHELVNRFGYAPPIKGAQGFVTEDGRFLDRVEAGKEAIRCGQIDKLRRPPKLYSEELI